MSRYSVGSTGRGERYVRIAAGAAVVLILAVGLAAGLKKYQSARTIVPANIKAQLSFGIFWPGTDAVLRGDKTTIKYDPTEKLFSYVARTAAGDQIIVSEQQTPESFVDVPTSFTKLTSTMQEYKSIDTSNGKVSLTRPVSLKGRQAAVMNARGVLVFLKPAKDIKDEDWARLANSLVFIN